MSKKYQIEGKNYKFDNTAFKKLVDKVAAEKFDGSKRKVYIDFCKFTDRIDDSYKTIAKWYESTNGPVNNIDLDYIAQYFTVPISDFLIEDNIKKEKAMDKNVFNDVKADKIVKFNEIQKSEFIKIKNMILDYIYSFYSPYQTDIDLQLDIVNQENAPCFELENPSGYWVNRMLNKKPHMVPDQYFTENEISIIKDAIENEEKIMNL